MPYFPENVDNVTVQIGQSAELRCKVENLNNYKVRGLKTQFHLPHITQPFTRIWTLLSSCFLISLKVAWVRVDTQTILTIHNNVITRNPRISLVRPSSNEWSLKLQRVQPNDRGWYMCQINTDPMRHRSGYFEVVGKSFQLKTWKVHIWIFVTQFRLRSFPKMRVLIWWCVRGKTWRFLATQLDILHRT